jgi:hypothetical protein
MNNNILVLVPLPAVVILVLDGSSFCVSRTKNGEEKCECESKWQGRREVGV